MGGTISNIKLNYEDVQICCQNTQWYIINTMSPDKQDCLIINTIDINKEEEILNSLMKTNKNAYILVYGTNNNDETIVEKYKHLNQCGFTNVFLYVGGMFEWLLLNDIYGNDLFPVIGRELDILKYKGIRVFNNKYIT